MDLLSNAGQAYGLQHYIPSPVYSGDSDSTPVPLDGSLTNGFLDLPLTSMASPEAETLSWAKMSREARYVKLALSQSYSQENPGSIALNGSWYASEVGPGEQYRVKARIETTSNWNSRAEACLFIFGYRYGYLDGSRVTYDLFGQGYSPHPNSVQEVDRVFTVNENYRHITMNPNIFMRGSYGSYDSVAMIISNCTVERV